MKLLFDTEDQTLTPYLAEGDINIDAFFEKCAKYGNPQTMIMLATNFGFGFGTCKDFARQALNRHENKLAYYEKGKEYRIYDGFCLKPNRDNPAHYGIRVIGDLQLHIAILPVGDKIEVSVVTVEGDNFSVLYSGSIKAEKYKANPVAVAAIPDLSFTHEGKEISINPIEIYIQDSKIEMLSIAGRQIINMQVDPENSTHQLDNLIKHLPTI